MLNGPLAYRAIGCSAKGRVEAVTESSNGSWQVDPWGDGQTLRWWDGSAWTGHVQPIQPTMVATQSTPPSLVPGMTTFILGLVMSVAFGGGLLIAISRNNARDSARAGISEIGGGIGAVESSPFPWVWLVLASIGVVTTIVGLIMSIAAISK